MARLAKFDERQILDAAASLIASGGPAAATMTAIADVIGAPNGSIYHRFKSRDELLGRLWLSRAKTFQDQWAAALRDPDPVRAGLEAALSLPRLVRTDISCAKAMLLYRRTDFLSDGWPPVMQAEAERLGRQIKIETSAITKRLFGRETAAATRTVAFATIDIPMAAVRRYVSEGKAPPAHVDALIQRAYHAIINDLDIR